MRNQSQDKSSDLITAVSLETLRARVNGRHEESVFFAAPGNTPARTESSARDAEIRAMMASLFDRTSAEMPSLPRSGGETM